jgi:Domain of unknown function (DUF6268)
LISVNKINKLIPVYLAQSHPAAFVDQSHRFWYQLRVNFAAINNKTNFMIKYSFLKVLGVLALFFLGIGLAFNSQAQNANEFLSINYYHLRQSEFKDIGGKAALNNFEVNLVTPAIKLGRRTTINNGLYYRMSDYSFENLHTDWSGLPDRLHDIRYSLIFRHQLSQRWTLLMTPRLSVRSNFDESLSSDDLFPGITALALRTTSSGRMRWGIGLTYNNDFHRNTIMPVAALYYASERMRLNITLPNNGQLIFTPSKRFEYGLSFNIEPAIYHINDITINKYPVKYLRTLNALVSPTASYNLAGNIWLSARAGFVLMRNYDLWDQDYEAKDDVMENHIDPAPFASAGISMRLGNRTGK